MSNASQAPANSNSLRVNACVTNRRTLRSGTSSEDVSCEIAELELSLQSGTLVTLGRAIMVFSGEDGSMRPEDIVSAEFSIDLEPYFERHQELVWRAIFDALVDATNSAVKIRCADDVSRVAGNDG